MNQLEGKKRKIVQLLILRIFVIVAFFKVPRIFFEKLIEGKNFLNGRDILFSLLVMIVLYGCFMLLFQSKYFKEKLEFNLEKKEIKTFYCKWSFRIYFIQILDIALYIFHQSPQWTGKQMSLFLVCVLVYMFLIYIIENRYFLSRITKIASDV